MLQTTHLLRRAAQTNPLGIATIFGERSQTWATFIARVARTAGALDALGLRPGERIGILALNSDRYMEMLFAASWAGLVFVPINTRLAPPEITYWLADSGCTALAIDDVFLPALPAIRPGLPDLRHVIHIGEGPALEGTLPLATIYDSAPPLPDRAGSGSDLAALYYTGGTTGRSKGVMLSHANLVTNVMTTLGGLRVAEKPVFLHVAPMFHIADSICLLMMTALGATQVIMARFDPAAVLRGVAAHGITDMLLVPTMVNMVVNHPEATQHDLSSLNGVIYGASPMPEAVIDRAMAVMPHVRFTQAYGQTEAAPVMTMLSPTQHGPDPVQRKRMRSAGTAVLAYDLRILDDNDREVPRGTVGEICGRGPCVMLGYWNQPELSAHTLRNGWLHTGDGGMMDADGYVYVVDRMKDMIISGGENVYSAEVEEAVYSHPAVAECAVIGVPDPKWGERVHAIVRCKPGLEISADDLIAHCHTRIAGFKCPRSVVFREEALPLSGAGKILKAELRRPYWQAETRQVH